MSSFTIDPSQISNIIAIVFTVFIAMALLLICVFANTRKRIIQIQIEISLIKSKLQIV